VDQLFIDESDLYKNLPYVTKMNRIAGLPNSESNRAIDMFIKTRYLKDKSGGRALYSPKARRSRTRWQRCTPRSVISPRKCSRPAAWSISTPGPQLRRGGYIAGTRPGRIGLPDAYAICQIREPAGAALDVPQLCGCADRRHAQAPTARRCRRKTLYRRRARIGRP